ncbi:DUF58 domain-containing protein [Bacillus sp. AFS015802]|uniref:DUF58 domain-containing protein n=1 Tax=Bacillus sp. AFS015802 TaxID=2033486 RepID=UPI000BF30C22|nr:DUF58 domain-containing protein [Bacillus sp. AFS015802]PFA68871.1 DUF58 domain-containing protein [Bacillus sp. AFS015802]
MGHHKGARLASYQGSSLEFSDYQLYEIGDDVRQIDWNVYARTEKVYVKRYLDERECKIHIYLDCTNSMITGDRKWKRARELAGALSFLALSNDDRLTLHCVGAQKSFMKKGSRDAKGILFDIGQLSPESGGGTSFFGEMIKGVRDKSSVTFIISDGLEPISGIEDALKKLSLKKEMTYFIQLLDEEELSPSSQGDVKLIDSENRREVDVSLNPDLVAKYQERLMGHNAMVESLCKKWGFGYVRTTCLTSLNEVFFKKFKENGWIR